MRVTVRLEPAIGQLLGARLTLSERQTVLTVHGVSSNDRDRPTALDSANPARNFTLSVSERIRAITIGVPAYAARKRKIEDDEARFTAQLVELHDGLTAKQRSSEEIEVAVVAAAHALDLTKLNELVAKHNRYYPMEANLPMDWKTGRYLLYGRYWEPEQPYSAARFLALFRAELALRKATVEP
jgi:hypothetical protein